jgi:small nuclear ribonucleoprotein (snRNP)-like protein
VKSYRRVAYSKTVIVNLATGRAFRGVLYETRGDLLVLKNAELIEDDRIVAIEGSVVLDRRNIDFVQVIA